MGWLARVAALVAAAAACAIACAAGAAADVQLLEELWPGLHDSTEQTIVNTERGLAGWTEGVEHRVRTVVAPVTVSWLGPHVLYLEEFLQDEPESLRRQLILQLTPQGPPEAAVRVHLFSFTEPRRWAHLDRRPQLAATLKQSDLAGNSGCDLVLARDGERFIGGTVGQLCDDGPGGAARYVDYQVVIGQDIYWYHRRVLRRRGDELREEVIGYNWFQLNEAQLFTCRVDWSPTGRAADLRPLRRLELRDQGGRAQLSTPDGRTLEIVLHGQDWPYLGERDALILMVQEKRAVAQAGTGQHEGRESAAAPGSASAAAAGSASAAAPGSASAAARPVRSFELDTIGSAWSEIDSGQVTLQLDWLHVRCGPLVPDTDELSGGLRQPPLVLPAPAGRAAAPG